MRFRNLIWLAFLVLTACSNAAEDAVRGQLIDPSSAEFKEVKRCPGDREVWQGEVNGKNRMGAYTGFKPFFFDGISVAFAGQTEFSTLMDRCYSNLRDSESLEVGSDMSTVDEFDESGTKWSVSADTNPLDDSKTVVASLAADEGAARFNGPVRLVARCQSNQTEAYAIWGEYLGDDSGSVYSEFKNVLVRIGDKDAITQRWDISTDKEATFAPSAINFLRELADSKRLVLQTVPYNEAPMTAIFDTTGARQAFQELSETCGWKID